MNEEEIEKMVNVIPLNKDSDNIVFIAARAISKEDLVNLSKALDEKNTNYNSLVMVHGDPHEVVKLVSVKELMEKKS